VFRSILKNVWVLPGGCLTVNQTTCKEYQTNIM